MTKEQTALARRLAAHPKWRWMPGMLATHDEDATRRVLSLDEDDDIWVSNGCYCEWLDSNNEIDLWYPDLDDPATQGCLLAMLDDAVGDWSWTYERDDDSTCLDISENAPGHEMRKLSDGWTPHPGYWSIAEALLGMWEATTDD